MTTPDFSPSNAMRRWCRHKSRSRFGRRPAFRPRLVELEDRNAPATLSVGNIAGDLVITDTAGVFNDMTMSVASGNLVIADAAEQFDGIGGFAGASLSNGDKTFSIPLTSLAGANVSINGAAGNDSLSIHALSGINSGLSIGSLSDPFGNVTFAGAVSLPAGKSLTVWGGSITASGALVTNGDPITLNATNGITLSNALVSGGGAMNVNADSDADGTGALTVNTPLAEIVDPNPAPGNKFGNLLVVLANGNVVVTSPFDDAGGTNAGAVYLFNGVTGALISTLRGSKANDNVGSGDVPALSNGNFVVCSPDWDNGAATDAGAVTWGSGTSGVSGIVSSANSLVGSSANDRVGASSVKTLSNGNYVVTAPSWDNGAVTNAGAATWGSGTSGVSGVISSANSLVGNSKDDNVGSGAGTSGVTVLSNGNYVVISMNWTNGGVTGAGAVTWGSGTSGVSGVVSSANSLVGSSKDDYVGYNGVRALSNGNYVVSSFYWDNGAATDAGAVTWGSGTSGVSGVVSSSNSLVGSSKNNLIGDGGVTSLTSGNYVVRSTHWDNGAATDAGAVTWGSGTSGVSGVVSSANSLVGSSSYDRVGNNGVTVLSNGNFVVNSFLWDNGPATDAGAVTWGSGTSGVSGVVSSANSLVGSSANDQVGGSVTALGNGNYVVSSPKWDNGAATDAGAATWGSGTAGVSGVISSTNSLVGNSTNDQVGYGDATALTNGNYVVFSQYWDNGAVADVGAATWGSGTSGISGVISSANSLVGSTASDRVGNFGAAALSNGNYVVRSTAWDNGAATDAGAVTWGSGTSGVSGVVSSANSLVGSTVNDLLGTGGVTALPSGNYVVHSFAWDNGAVANAGAVTWGSGTSGVSGVVSSDNSLVGSSANDQVGLSLVTVLSNGNYVVRTANWDNGAVADAGAVTWGSGTSGVSGVVSSVNSLIGGSDSDQVGNSITALSNGNYVVSSLGWHQGATSNVGAVTWGSGTSGVVGVVSSANSLVGSSFFDNVGTNVTALSDGNYVVRSPNWRNGAVDEAGAVTWGSGTSGVSGVVSSANSFVGNSVTSGLQTVSVDNTTGRFFARFTTDGTGRIYSGTQIKGTYGLDAGAGSVSLAAGNGNGVAPILPGVDVKAASTSFLSGSDLTINIQGTTVDSPYTQLTTSGPLSLTGADLSLTGSYVPLPGDIFTIVSATTRSGLFNNRPDGSTFAFNGVTLRIDYTSTAVTLAVVSLPTVASINPIAGPTTGGTLVIITGNGFTGATAVTFGGTNAASFTVNSGTQITATAPAHAAGVVDVIVTTPAGSSTTEGTVNDFTYTLAPAPAFESMVINGGEMWTVNSYGEKPTGLAGNNSIVGQLYVEFDIGVTIGGGAFTIDAGPVTQDIIPVGGVTPVAAGTNVVAVIVEPDASTLDGNGGYKGYRLRFSGSADYLNTFDNGPTGTGGVGNISTTLKDGFYKLNVNGAAIHAGNTLAGPPMAGLATESFWVMYASYALDDRDVVGEGHTGTPGDGTSIISVNASLVDFAQTNGFGYGTSLTGSLGQAYNANFDWNLDGDVGDDLIEFAKRFGAQWSF